MLHMGIYQCHLVLPEAYFLMWSILCIPLNSRLSQSWLCSLWSTPFSSLLPLSWGSPSDLWRQFLWLSLMSFLLPVLSGEPAEVFLSTEAWWNLVIFRLTEFVQMCQYFYRWYKLILQKKKKAWGGHWLMQTHFFSMEGKRMWKHTRSFSPGKGGCWWCNAHFQYNRSVLPHALTMRNPGWHL